MTRARTVRGLVPPALTWPDSPPPSTVVESFWVYAIRKTGDAGNATPRSGKWLLFVPRERMDQTWEIVAKATTEGKLGPSSKCGTARPNPNARDPRSVVICVYTNDYDDSVDVDRVRAALRELGFVRRIPYKLDSVTLEGRYAVRGDQRIASRWA